MEVIGGGIRIKKGARSGEVTFMLSVVVMKYQGLVDPEDKPFGNVLPFEVQVKIMFWVECILTDEKRQKVNHELRLLPKCDVTGFPQHLGDDRWWNQSNYDGPRNHETHCYCGCTMRFFY